MPAGQPARQLDPAAVCRRAHRSDRAEVDELEHRCRQVDTVRRAEALHVDDLVAGKNAEACGSA